ncbi:MAG: PilZ domain-containing protein, partial [Shewanella sp.]
MGEHTKGFQERRCSLRVDMEAERVLLSWMDAAGTLHT